MYVYIYIYICNDSLGFWVHISCSYGVLMGLLKQAARVFGYGKFSYFPKLGWKGLGFRGSGFRV